MPPTPKKRKAPPSPVSFDSAPPAAKKRMASNESDENIFDYDDEEGSDMDYDDGDSSINDGTLYPDPCPSPLLRFAV